MRRPAAIQKIKEVLMSVAPRSEAYIFGSEARGDATKDSDFDLLILTEQSELTYKEKEAIVNPLFMLEYSDNIEVNVLIYTKEEWNNRPFMTPFQLNIINEGIRL